MTDLSTLNPQQKDAVLQSINNNVVLLAGAGSGKTSTLVKRAQYLIDDLGVSSNAIMIVTFTNKAAGEIRDRMMKVTNDAYKMWIGTFHRICTRLIRMFGHHIGIQSFTIMDGKDQKALIKEILQASGSDASPYLVNQAVGKISEYKNNMRKPSAVLLDDKEDKVMAVTYQEYNNICWRRKSFDFDDLIIYAILLLAQYPEVSQWVHDNIKYLMVDESQDTNSAQFTLIKLLAGDNNVMLVGDVNQSIYAFRNAKPEYLEYFANTHPNTIKLKLEQNYRSTKTIIDAANNVVNYNKFGTKLHMFCANEQGDLIQLRPSLDPYDEARWIAMEIAMSGKPLSDFAIIYRTNTQSRVLEEVFTQNGIGYVIFGSQSFYTRKEVRDLLAFLKVFVNPNDVDAFKRVLALQKGVGKVTVEKCIEYAIVNKLDFKHCIPAYLKVSNTLNTAPGRRMLSVHMVLSSNALTCSDVVSDVLFHTDYRTELQNVKTEETEEKLAIIDEFQTMLKSVEEKDSGSSMSEIIDQISLLSDAKGEEKATANAVKFMTAHSSKGLEFDTVFMAGCEEGVFPHANSINEGTIDAIEEERRLFYVAMTRAKKKLYITYARQRKAGKDGGLIVSSMSRFIREIPRNLTEEAF